MTNDVFLLCSRGLTWQRHWLHMGLGSLHFFHTELPPWELPSLGPWVELEGRRGWAPHFLHLSSDHIQQCLQHSTREPRSKRKPLSGRSLLLSSSIHAESTNVSLHVEREFLVQALLYLTSHQIQFPLRELESYIFLFQLWKLKHLRSSICEDQNLFVQTLVDIGAGIGLFSLMAAARGHQVIAFETAPHSIESFNASIHYNGFQDHIQIHQVDDSNIIHLCLQPKKKL